MPNYTKLEKEILTPGQVALVAASRAPAIGALKDAALYRAIAEIEAEMTGQYQGDGMWLVKVTKVWQANGASGDSLLTHEQWLVPEDGETNPWEKL